MYVIYDSERDLTNVAANVPLQINSCGINTTRRSGRPTDEDVLVRRPAGRLDYQLLYMVSGHADYLLDGEWQTVGEGKIVLYRPQVPQFYRTYSQVPMLCRWVHFSGTEATSLLEECGMGQGNLFSPGLCPAAEALLKSMVVEILHREPMYRIVVESQFRQAMALFGRQMAQRKGSVASSSRQRILSIVEYMNRHYFEPLQTEELAARCGLSKYHFIHLFRMCMGMTPYSYLIRIRMERAETLLQTGDMTVQEVAFVCGYNDPLYFSRAFSRHFGVSPTDYKQRFFSENERKLFSIPKPVIPENGERKF